MISNVLGKLNYLYGTSFVYGTSEDLKDVVPNAALVKAFVHNG